MTFPDIFPSNITSGLQDVNYYEAKQIEAFFERCSASYLFGKKLEIVKEIKDGGGDLFEKCELKTF